MNVIFIEDNQIIGNLEIDNINLFIQTLKSVDQIKLHNKYADVSEIFFDVLNSTLEVHIRLFI
ncbi:hypothetical protein [Robertmurraya sp. Marseille-Q9965]